MNPAASTPGVTRGCGRRVQGGIYLETGVGVFGGQSIWGFICDVPQPFTAPHTLGVDMRQVGGVWHIINHVGSKHWESPADFIEEGIRWGFSTRISRDMDLSVLTSESRIIHVHSKGALLNPEAFAPDVKVHEHVCRCAQHRQKNFQPITNFTDLVASFLGHDATLGNGTLHHHITDHPKGGVHGGRMVGCSYFHWAFAQPTECFVYSDGDMLDQVEHFTQKELDTVFGPGAVDQPIHLFREYLHTHHLQFIRQGNPSGSNDYRVYPISVANPRHKEPEWVSAAIAILPITNASVIEAEDGSHLGTLEQKRQQLAGTIGVSAERA